MENLNPEILEIEGGFRSGALPDKPDPRDRKLDDIAVGSAPPMTEQDWVRGFDIEKELNITMPMQNQGSSLSCVGQSFSQFASVLDTTKTGKYIMTSAKAIYSRIRLPNGAAYFRDGAAQLVDFGRIYESMVRSYYGNGSTNEELFKDTSWITPEIIEFASRMRFAEYRTPISTAHDMTMDKWAMTIRDNHGMVAGVVGNNNGTWFTNEPKPPTNLVPQNQLWYHAVYFGKFGVDSLGKYIATPNSWGTRGKTQLHPDGWQKLRAEWFEGQGRWLFSPWTLILKDSIYNNSMDINKFLLDNDLKFIRNQETGAFGRIIAKKLRVAVTDDRAALMLMDAAVRQNGKNITNAEWEKLPKENF